MRHLKTIQVLLVLLAALPWCAPVRAGDAGAEAVDARKIRNYRDALAARDSTGLNREFNFRTRMTFMVCTGHAAKTAVIAVLDTLPGIVGATVPFKVVEYLILGLDDLADELERRDAGASPICEGQSAAIHSVDDPRLGYAVVGALAGGLSPIADLPVMLSERKLFVVGEPALFPVTQAAYAGTAVTARRMVRACALEESLLGEVMAEAHAHGVELRSLSSPDDFHQRIIYR